MAIEEAILVESGYVNPGSGIEPETSPVASQSEIEEAMGSNQEELGYLDQASIHTTNLSFPNCRHSV